MDRRSLPPPAECLLAVAVVAAPAPVALWLHLRGVPAEGAAGWGVMGFWLLAVFVALRLAGRRPAEIGLGREGLAASVGLAMALPLVTLALAAVRGDLAAAPRREPAVLLERAAYCLLASGAAQEVLFRGFVLSAFRRWRGPVVGLLVSSLLYAAAHARMPIEGRAALFVLGGYHGLVVLGTRNVWGPVAAHGLYNLAFGYLLTTRVAVL